MTLFPDYANIVFGSRKGGDALNGAKLLNDVFERHRSEKSLKKMKKVLDILDKIL